MALLRVFFVFICLTTFCLGKSARKKTGKQRDCPHPAVLKNGTQLPTDNIVDDYKAVAEIKFDGTLDRWERKRSCKIKCVNGEWVGPLCLEDGVTGDGRFQPIFQGCNSTMFHQNFVISYKNKTVLHAREFNHGANIQMRCKMYGVYKLIGDARLSCHNGLWKNRPPTCIPTTSVRNFTDDSAPPTVLVKVTSGSASIEPTGELAVYPGSIVHLECLYMRSHGEPEWSWTSIYRKYPTGWSIAHEDRDWKYRLSIYYTKLHDTGIYTCSTPKGLTHSVVINVASANCDTSRMTSNDPYMAIEIEGSRLGQTVFFTCGEGFRLNGSANITCQLSGTWSGYIPNCLPIVCPNLVISDPYVKLVKQDVTYGGNAIFECPYGFKLLGTPNMLCKDNGQWSSVVPTCKEITCAQPLIPINGRLEIGNETLISRYKVGTIFRFTCIEPYQPVGEDTIICSETGYWSNPPPFCKTRCPHPGEPENGIFSPTKPSYDVGERLTLSCNEGHVPSFMSKPRCQRDGTWSEVEVECKPMEYLEKLGSNISSPKLSSITVGEDLQDENDNVTLH